MAKKVAITSGTVSLSYLPNLELDLIKGIFGILHPHKDITHSGLHLGHPGLHNLYDVLSQNLPVLHGTSILNRDVLLLSHLLELVCHRHHHSTKNINFDTTFHVLRLYPTDLIPVDGFWVLRAVPRTVNCEADCVAKLGVGSGCCNAFCQKLLHNIEDRAGVGKGISKLYVTIDLEDTRVGRTRLLENECSNPKRHESFHIYCAHTVSNVAFSIKQDDPIGVTLIGRAYVPVQQLLTESHIHYSVKEKVCRVTLYQDAHVDDKFISDIIPLTEDRVMATHDEDMRQYFYDCEVHCVLCLRNPDNLHSIIQGIEISTMFTHHQKVVAVDGELLDGESKRRIVSFIGGIDLTDGRYDTPHPIFRTIGTIHHDDFRQPCFHDASIVKGEPREPWHDIYCQLEGPVAWEVLLSFEQRRRKQGEKDLVVPLRELHVIFIPPSPVTP
ncbi:hypothetical protein J1N35_002942 [Gossypium stocksii]|uniref:phospholipase D n=1 Tax=Gossypium stocksii TaxID=47602 RepID=A0A9D3WNE0_9ROSI|nr:hypothetical protein J1N35_002942 [Gossypium stocksii]